MSGARLWRIGGVVACVVCASTMSSRAERFGLICTLIGNPSVTDSYTIDTSANTVTLQTGAVLRAAITAAAIDFKWESSTLRSTYHIDRATGIKTQTNIGLQTGTVAPTNPYKCEKMQGF